VAPQPADLVHNKAVSLSRRKTFCSFPALGPSAHCIFLQACALLVASSNGSQWLVKSLQRLKLLAKLSYSWATLSAETDAKDEAGSKGYNFGANAPSWASVLALYTPPEVTPPVNNISITDTRSVLLHGT